MAHDATAWIVGEHTLQATTGLFSSVSHTDHPGMNGIADAYPAPVMQRYPAGATGGIEHSIQQRPVGDGIRTIFHILCLAVGRSHRTGIQVVASNHQRSIHLSFFNEPVEYGAHF